MAFEGNNLVVNDRNRRARDTTIDAYVPRWKALEKSCARIFLGSEREDIPFLRQSER